MQFQFRNQFGNSSLTRAKKFDAHSPFHKFIEDVQNKRSKLFPDQIRIPGRKPKYILTIAFLISLYSMAKLSQIKSSRGTRDANIQKMHRKVEPFFSSIQDIQYTILKHRQDLLLAEIFKEKGGVQYLKKFKRFHNEVAWANPQRKKFISGGQGRSSKSLSENTFGRIFNGFYFQNA